MFYIEIMAMKIQYSSLYLKVLVVLDFDIYKSNLATLP